MHQRIQILCIAMAFAPLLMGADAGCVIAPAPDSIVNRSPVAVTGAIIGEKEGAFVDGSIQLTVNGAELPFVDTDVATPGKTWAYPSVNLRPGLNQFGGSTIRFVNGVFEIGSVIPFMLELKSDLASAGTQTVFLDFSDARIDAQLRAIASHTLATISQEQLDGFPARVKNQIRSFFRDAYAAESAISIVNAPRPDTHIVKFTIGMECGGFGISPGDYRNSNKAQQSSIFVNAFRCLFVENDALLRSTPARRTDSLGQRVADIGIAIGRTAAHEFGHSLGLVAEGDNNLHGCEDFHNCEDYDASHPLADRFFDGHFIMDPGPRSLVFARIGQSNAMNREELLPRFNNYNRSYLEIIHP